MDRRLFFQNLIGGTAALAIAPKLFSQIVEAPYETPPERLFVKGEGLWIFDSSGTGDRLVAWSSLHGASLEMRRPIIELSSDYHTSTYKEYTAGKSEISFQADNLRLIDYSILDMNDQVFQIVMKTQDHTYQSSGLLTEWSLSGMVFEDGPEDIFSARFQSIGETTVI